MTNKETIEAMLRYIENHPYLITGLCMIEYRVTGKYGEIIEQYEPTISSKFWWQWSYRGWHNAYWWPLTEKGMRKRKEFLKHLLTKFVDY